MISQFWTMIMLLAPYEIYPKELATVNVLDLIFLPRHEIFLFHGK